MNGQKSRVRGRTLQVVGLDRYWFELSATGLYVRRYRARVGTWASFTDLALLAQGQLSLPLPLDHKLAKSAVVARE